MSAVGKVFSTILKLIFPEEIYEWLMSRIYRTKQVMTSNATLRTFWFILLFPIVLSFSLLMAIIKMILIWVLRSDYYGFLRYGLNLFYTDVVSQKIGFRTALKRSYLLYVLATKGKEKKMSFGSLNPDKTFYVIRPHYYSNVENELTPFRWHLLAHYFYNMAHLARAVEKGWIPVIDWENYGPFAHGEDYPVNGTRNCWEYYWNQPSEYTLAEVYQSKKVILSIQNLINNNRHVPASTLNPPLQAYLDDCALRCPPYDQLITLNDTTSLYIKERQEMLFPEGARILGVSVRGTAYNIAHASRHAKQPETEELFALIRNAVQDWNMDYVFFACEKEEIVDIMRKEFKGRLLSLPRLRYDNSTEPKFLLDTIGVDHALKLDPSYFNPLYQPGQRYQTNLDYLTEMVLLSRCTSLLASYSSGIRAVAIWNAGKYEHMHIIDKGLWK